MSCNHQATNLVQILQYKINFKKIVKILLVRAINTLSVRFFLKIENLLVEKNRISLFYFYCNILYKRRLRGLYKPMKCE